jgi:hypothetical protein
MTWTKGKYVVGEIPSEVGSVLAAVLIPEYVGHDRIRDVFLPGTIRSAGFFILDNDKKIQVYGRSVSLDVSSMPNDVVQINKILLLEGLD